VCSDFPNSLYNGSKFGGGGGGGERLLRTNIYQKFVSDQDTLFVLYTAWCVFFVVGVFSHLQYTLHVAGNERHCKR